MNSTAFDYSYQPTLREETLMLGAVTAITKTHGVTSPQDVKNLLLMAFPYLTSDAINYWCDWFGIYGNKHSMGDAHSPLGEISPKS